MTKERVVIPTELQPNLSAVHSALGGSGNVAWRAAVEGREPGSASDWYGNALSAVLLLVGDSRIDYLTQYGDLKREESAKVGALVFTESLVVHLDCTVTADGERPRWTVSTVGLAGLRRIAVDTAGSVFDANIDAEWPRVHSVELTFEDGLTLCVEPAGRNRQHRAALAEYVQKLAERLR